jgi:subfamily B ATP-binding cassette protein MsbA
LAGNIRLSLKNARLEAGSYFINGLAGRAILGLVIFYGGYQVIKGGMTLGDLSAISIYLAQLTGLQGAAMQFFQQASLGSISCQRLEEIFACRPQASEEKSAIFFRIPRGRIEFKDATFGYPAGKKIFENFNLVIPSGACFGLSGPSGSGKTTLINLLLRLYKLDKGEIFIDGCDIRGIKADAFYGQIGVALQEPFLWNDTLGNNIRYGNKDAPWQEVEEAAKIACANDFIATLPQGYDTVIGENACKISEGQKQRIAIARALLKRPKILILDEALSCVDTESEGAIIGNIKNALSQSTIIIISHRPSVIEKTDTIYSLNSSLLTLTAPA